MIKGEDGIWASRFPLSFLLNASDVADMLRFLETAQRVFKNMFCKTLLAKSFCSQGLMFRKALNLETRCSLSKRYP